MIHPSKILKELGISALKHLGQNFQVDTHVVANAAAFIPAGARVLEIGPGLGAWTEIFHARGHEMVLVEKDRTLAKRLIELYQSDSRMTVIEGDFLELDIHAEPVCSCTAAVGNLPFYVTSDLLLHIIVDSPQITRAIFGVQLEVAERLAAAKGSSLAIALGAQGKIKIAGKISRHSFFPAPNVDAAMISFERTPGKNRPHLRTLLKAAFWGKRKALGTALRKNPFWDSDAAAQNWTTRLTAPPAAIAAFLEKRADDLDVADFCTLYDFLTGNGLPGKPPVADERASG